MKDELLRLAALCEQAEGPSRTLGAHVEIAMRGFPELAYQQKCSFRPKGSPEPDRLEWAADWFGAGPTASIDAALTLVPEGFDWIIGRTNGGITVYAEVGGTGGDYTRFAATPSLALCAASLRARASMEKTDG